MSRVHFKRRRRARLANYAKGGETASNLAAPSVVTALKWCALWLVEKEKTHLPTTPDTLRGFWSSADGVRFRDTFRSTSGRKTLVQTELEVFIFKGSPSKIIYES
jgi:hypothetical protein